MVYLFSVLVGRDIPALVSAMIASLESLRFLSAETASAIANRYGTPVYVYHQPSLEAAARRALAFPNAFGLTVRFAMKACPNAAVLKCFHGLGLHIDASSGFEVERALRAGLPADHISLSTQELPHDFAGLIKQGVRFNACSLDQLRRFGEAFPEHSLGLRFNPGLGSGGTGKTNVGGPASSFGIWHEQVDEVEMLLEAHRLTAVRIHTHIGSGSDPAVWQKVAHLSLALVRRFPSVTTLNLGGGYKVARMSDEKGTDLAVVGAPVMKAFEALADETGRRLHLEIEPGTYLVANAGALLCRVQDNVSTGEGGYAFLKLDAGMTDILRPSLYGARHPLIILSSTANQVAPQPYVIVGHCCESGDLLTTAAGEPETLAPRLLAPASIGDLCVIEGAGAYCAAMSTKNYNSFPEAPEVMLHADGTFRLIRRRQTLDQILANECDDPASS